MSVEKHVPRGRLGRLLGLPPKVYKCHGRDGRWRHEHQGPIWYVGGRELIPCIHCFERVIPAERYVPSASRAYRGPR